MTKCIFMNTGQKEASIEQHAMRVIDSSHLHSLGTLLVCDASAIGCWSVMQVLFSPVW